MSRVTLKFDSLTTPEARKLVIAHRKATGDGSPSHGIKPRLGIEGPECWSLDTEPLTSDQFVAFQRFAADHNELAHLFPEVAATLLAEYVERSAETIDEILGPRPERTPEQRRQGRPGLELHGQ